MPLLAPGGTVITMFPAASTVPLNGEVEIVATAIENGTSTTPPTNGTDDADDADDADHPDDDVDDWRRHAGAQRHVDHVHDNHWTDRAERSANK